MPLWILNNKKKLSFYLQLLKYSTCSSKHRSALFSTCWIFFLLFMLLNLFFVAAKEEQHVLQSEKKRSREARVHADMFLQPVTQIYSYFQNSAYIMKQCQSQHLVILISSCSKQIPKHRKNFKVRLFSMEERPILRLCIRRSQQQQRNHIFLSQVLTGFSCQTHGVFSTPWACKHQAFWVSVLVCKETKH